MPSKNDVTDVDLKRKADKASRMRHLWTKMGGVISFISSRGHQDNHLNPSRQVRTRNGLVEGYRLNIADQKNVDIFLGVPFAKPPVGDLRFKKPVDAEDWEGVKKCVRFGPRAPQADFFWEKYTLGVKTSEDCLYLNVFSPEWKSKEDTKLHSVMVYVHGGGFLIDSAVKYGDVGIAKYLCRHDVVVVTIQYRLGLLGFFSTGDDACPTNLGLWDMTKALEWVRDNIHAFGGDPRKITVFGQSAGGASVDFLSISPHSRDLFQQVVPMAGNGECEWSTVAEPKLVASCKDFATRKHWDGGSEENATSEMISYLKTRKEKEFERRLLTRKGVDVSKIGLDLAPVIGKSPEDFLPKPIDELRKEAPKKNIMVGTCEYEGLLFATLGPTNFDVKGIDKLLDLVITNEYHEDYVDLRREARALYLRKEGDEDDRDAAARGFIRLYSDLFVNNGTYKYAYKMTQFGHKVYMYSFDYYNPKSFGLLALRTPFKAATHCTELTYIFGVSIVFNFRMTDEDKAMLDLMTRMWTNFAKYGNPNGPYEDSSVFDFKWEPTDPEHPLKFLSIAKKCEMKDEYHEHRANFWKKIKLSAKCC
ncbi:unnamed protein product [Caenorhabditis auriculariae]|uniref:Carboxylic ester hydrolase n=1 Tax=Caenorhabditis auriculariae TaxID=2777116 RepID=A0A8S1H6X7_9PELO|nr:unnamed protein product [Caenorhabditis auriculariae]